MKKTACLLWVLLLVTSGAWANNLDLSTVPARHSVELTIYNSEDLTLVRESRTLGFKKGLNPLQFSWSNTLIDPTSVELTFPQASASLRLLDATFPHDKPQMLYWNLEADRDLTARVEISYFTSGIQWDAEYLAISNNPQTHLDLEGLVRIHNQSGEEYENAQVRLVVGEINLVEKIAQLAQVSPERVSMLDGEDYRMLRHKAARQVMAPRMEMELAAGMMPPAPSPAAAQPKEVAKEGLGDYFIYSIEGTETIPDGWAKRLSSFRAADIPIETVYRYRLEEYGDQLVRLYLLTNDQESGLGDTPIPNGNMRIFRDDGTGGLMYLTELNIQYVPLGDKLELNLGSNPELVFELVKKRVFRDNIWLRMTKGNVYKRLDDGHIQVDHKAQVEGWNEHGLYEQRIRNYSDEAVAVEIRRSYPGDVTFISALDAKSHDFRTVEFSTSVAPATQVNLEYEVVTAQGYNAKQNQVIPKARN